MLKFFAEKMWVAATHIFSTKNIRILFIESAKTVNEITLNELVKLTRLWTTGPWYFKNIFFFSKKTGLGISCEKCYIYSPGYLLGQRANSADWYVFCHFTFVIFCSVSCTQSDQNILFVTNPALFRHWQVVKLTTLIFGTDKPLQTV